MKKVLLLLLIIIVFPSCTYVLTETAKVMEKNIIVVPPPPRSKPNEISVNDDYQISLPYSMNAIEENTEETLISYRDHYRSLYTVVSEGNLESLKNDKESDKHLNSAPLIERYTKLYKKSLKEEDLNARFEDYGLMKINGFEARQLKIFTIENNTSITYISTLIKDRSVVYHIISWTLSDRLDRNIGVMEQIPFTFQKKTIYNEIQ